MTPRLVHVVGLQKSGTTLLGRLLEKSGGVTRGFPGEGHEFWGNEPVFTPEGFPAGAIYQAAHGRRGHEATADDVTDEARRVLHERFAAAAGDAEHVLNKNPYNTVRLGWVRAIFPDALIVAMVRRPLPNVFSLVKKHHPHEGRGERPRDGWWGVKPAGWSSLVGDDKVEQCARQWQAVNAILHRDRAAVDLVIEYQQLCDDPEAWIAHVLDLAGAAGRWPDDVDPASLRCRDDEYRTGAALRSKNRLFRERGDLATPADERVELPPLTDAQIERVESICTAAAPAGSEP